MKNPKQTAAGYIRVSTEEQVQEGLSLRNQEQKIKAYAFAKGWTLTNIYRDNGCSAKNLHRDGMQALFEDLKQGKFEIVLVYKLDRLTRQMRDLWHILDLFEKSGISFVSVVDSFDTTTANGRLTLNILGSLAQWERDIISERTRDSLAYKAKNGEYLGTPPLGYKAEDKNLTQIENELQIVRMIKKLRRGKNKLSMQAIAEKLNLEGYISKRGRKFYASTVHYILKNSRYRAVA